MNEAIVYRILCLFICLAAGVEASLTLSLEPSPPIVVEAGAVVSQAFVIHNPQPQEAQGTLTLKLPEGWSALPFADPLVSLNGESQAVEILAIKVPANALAGTYSLSLCLEEAEVFFVVRVKENSTITSYIDEAPSYARSGDSYAITLTTTNTGNIETEVILETEEHLGFLVSPAKTTFSLPPRATQKTRFVVFTKKLEEIVKHNVLFAITNKSTEAVTTCLSQVELFPKKLTTVSRYHTFPLTTVFGYGMKNGSKQLFVEQYGEGSLGKKRQLEFFFRAPVISEVNVDRDLGGPPESGYLHYFTPKFDAYVGDGVYTLTPLTMLNRFGRGGSLAFTPSRIETKGLCIYDSSSAPEGAAGEKITYIPLPFLRFSLASLQTHLTPFSKKLFETAGNSVSSSLLGEVSHKQGGDHTVEYSTTNPCFAAKRNAYYIYSRASPFSGGWYALQRIYAPSQFVGYYQDTSQLYASLGFPIVSKLQGTVSYNYAAYNLDKSAKRQKSAPRNWIGYGGLSYSFPFGLYTSLYYNYSQSKDSLHRQLGYKTHFLSASGGKNFEKWTVQGIFEYGRYEQLLGWDSRRTWQNAQLYTYYQPTAKMQYAIYTKLGYIELAPEIQWTRTYGASTSLLLARRFNLQLLYEFTNQKSIRHYINGRMKYTFKRGSYLELQGYFNEESKQTSTLEFLLSYTIPWNLPIRKNRSFGEVRGTLRGEGDVAQNLVVNCSGQRTLTDKKGTFAFPSLLPGEHKLYIEGSKEVTSPPLPLPLKVKGGETTSLQIQFTHPCKLQGTLPLFNDLEEKVDTLKQVSLSLESQETGKKIYAQTDDKGRFLFDKVSPGRWTLKVVSANPPPYYALEKEELLLDFFPGEEKTVELNLYPLKRQLRIIDSGDVH